MHYRKSKQLIEQFPPKQEALDELLRAWTPTCDQEREYVTIQKAEHRILAQDMYSKHALPVYRSANMDGIAVCYDQLENADFSTWEEGVHYCMADTGDDFPEPFDTVLRIEAVEFLEQGGIQLNMDMLVPIEKNQCVSHSGSKVKAEELLVKKGTQLNIMQLNLLAMGGYLELPVVRKPRVAYIPTGSELVSIGLPVKRGENVESNGVMVQALIEKWGAEAIIYPICKDIQTDLALMMQDAMKQADIVLINGGSSKGSEDYNSRMIEEQASFFQHHVRCAPGFPIGMGLINNQPVINMPGPPTATFAVMHWCIQALICHALGIEMPEKGTTFARLSEALIGSDAMEFYDCAYIEKKDGELWITPFDKKERTAATLGVMNAYIVLKPGTKYQVGDWIEAHWIN